MLLIIKMILSTTGTPGMPGAESSGVAEREVGNVVGLVSGEEAGRFVEVLDGSRDSLGKEERYQWDGVRPSIAIKIDTKDNENIKTTNDEKNGKGNASGGGDEGDMAKSSSRRERMTENV